MVTPVQLTFFTAVLDLTGAAQQLSDVLVGLVAANQGTDFEPKIRQLLLQADGANGNPVYVGHDATVAAAASGFQIPAGAAGVPSAPLSLGPCERSELRLSDLWVVGTAGQKLRVTVIPWQP